MFDGRHPEVGKERNRFLTEESGRRVYFPLVGPARVVPSGDEEARLKAIRLFLLIAFWALMTVSAALRPFFPAAPFPEGWIMLLVLGAHELITFRLVRRWTAISPADLSYARHVVAAHTKRGLISLCFVILGHAIGFVGLTVGLAWVGTQSPPPGWDDWTSFKKVSWLVLLVSLSALATYLAIGGYRAVTALRNKYRGQ